MTGVVMQGHLSSLRDLPMHGNLGHLGLKPKAVPCRRSATVAGNVSTAER
ncbi:hypothetical protein RISK_004814 [Rhodopirellula islandica]|uniref:Uncharacterized protein n=1 Tax=Rhodopirellula islandica TaxID=595434 RepID=A0A0J1B8P5_RHOIS|nr:hypothetical protein RISK_004814 [Rhodopirellula islandica]